MPAEARIIAELHHASTFAAYAPLYGPEWRPRPLGGRIKLWRRNLTPGSGVDTLVCVDGAVILGFAALGLNRDGLGDSHGELYTIYVHPKHWRRGIGSLLLAAAEQSLNNRGFADAVLWTLELNERARHFYERHDWHADGAVIADDDRADLRQVRYAKHLATE